MNNSANKNLEDAIRANDLEKVKAALDAGADIHYPISIDLNLSVRNWEFDNEGRVKLPGREDLTESPSKYWHPWAVFNKHFINVLEDLYDCIKEVEANQKPSEGDKVAVLNRLIDRLQKEENDIIGFRDVPLGVAAYLGQKEIVEELLNRGANIHAFGDSAFRFACINGHRDIAELLVERGANISADDHWAFRYACRYECNEIVDFLITQYLNKSDAGPIVRFWGIIPTQLKVDYAYINAANDHGLL